MVSIRFHRFRSIRLAGLALLVALLAGCGSTGEPADSAQPDAADVTTEVTDTTTEATSAPTSEAVDTTDEASAEASQITPGQVVEQTAADRTYMIYVPESADPSESTALVLALHGLGENAWSMLRRTQSMAEEHGIVLAYPVADNSAGSWEFETDSGYIADVLDAVEASANIDAERIYAIGHSQGGSFATYLTCPLGDRLNAVATNAFLLQHDADACGGPVTAEVLAIVGAEDPITSIGGPYIEESSWWTGGPLPGPWPEEAAAFATTNSCESDHLETEVAPDVIHHEYTCTEGRLEIYVHPKAHIWAGDGAIAEVDGFTANDAIWQFLEPSDA